MNYKKERNFIVAFEGEVVCGKWNILTGEFIGKSGKAVKSVPNAFTYNSLAYSAYSSMEEKAYKSAVEMYRQHKRYYTAKRAARMECLISLGLRAGQFSVLDEDIKLTKDLVEYCKENCYGVYNCTQVKEYLLIKKYKDFLENRPNWFTGTFVRLYDRIPTDFLKASLLRCESEHVVEAWNNIDSFIRDYYDMCIDLYGEAKITPNLLSNFAHLKYLYKLRKNELIDRDLKANNNKPFLYFNNEKYQARPILSTEAFHKEGESQHNCVERCYMNPAAKGETYIVTIRSIEEPEKSLVTCEVGLKGNIKQYLTYCNHGVRDPELLTFREAYQAHIYEGMKE